MKESLFFVRRLLVMGLSFSSLTLVYSRNTATTHDKYEESITLQLIDALSHSSSQDSFMYENNKERVDDISNLEDGGGRIRHRRDELTIVKKYNHADRSMSEKDEQQSENYSIPSHQQVTREGLLLAALGLIPEVDEHNISRNNRETRSETLFEGDIKPDYNSILKQYGEETVNQLQKSGMVLEGEDLMNVQTRNVFFDNRWDTRVDNVVQIPYQYDPKYYFSPSERYTLETALKALGDRSHVIQFNVRTTESSYINIIRDAGCYSYVGKLGGRQDLSLDTGCFINGIVEHEFLHALGFWHEQSRSDRDTYVTINWDNIDFEGQSNFNKFSDDPVYNLGSPYDYGSVMHYGAYDFTNNGLPTIDSKGNDIGQRIRADDEDIFQLQLLYQCASGHRNAISYDAKPCSTDCKCWEGQTGCAANGGSSACQGSLFCSGDTCTNAPTVSPAPTTSLTPSLSPSSSSQPTTISGDIYTRYYDTTYWVARPSVRYFELIHYKEDYVDAINFPATSGNFATSGKADQVAALFQGSLLFEEAGQYVIRIECDFTFDLYWDDAFLYSGSNPETVEFVGEFTSGSSRNIEIEYLELSGVASLVVYWRTPSMLDFVPVPAQAWKSLNAYTPTISPTPDKGNIYVQYYDAIGWSEIPSTGLSDLTHYKEEFITLINYPLTNGIFAGSGKADNVAAFFQGRLLFPENGEYFIRISCDYRFNFFLDGTLQYTSMTPVTTTFRGAFTSGSMSDIGIEFFEMSGSAELVVSWAIPSSLDFVPIQEESWIRMTSSSPSYAPTTKVSTPTKLPTTPPTKIPTINPTQHPTLFPTSFRGNVYVQYYNAIGWFGIPSSGLSDLTPYKEEYISLINYPLRNGAFAGSEKDDNVAAFFQGRLLFEEQGDYLIKISCDYTFNFFFDGILVYKSMAAESVSFVGFFTPRSTSLIGIEFFEMSGSSELVVSWVTPSSSDFVPIPEEAWKRMSSLSTSANQGPKSSTIQLSKNPSESPTITPTKIPTTPPFMMNEIEFGHNNSSLTSRVNQTITIDNNKPYESSAERKHIHWVSFSISVIAYKMFTLHS